MRVLLVEDDDAVASALAAALQRVGLAVDRAGDAEEGWQKHGDAALVLLDMGLPDSDGLALCRRIRAAQSEVPIIAVTARRAEASVVAALQSGVDDYVTKPYSTEVLLARIDAVMRRVGRGLMIGDVVVGDLALQPEDQRAALGDTELDLTPKEFELLLVLAQNAGHVVDRTALMEQIWNTTWVGGSRTLDVHVATLRAKLGRPDLIETVRGKGYRMPTAG
ncbi:response regulator transcription factor [Mumia zhuanghuii]|uniref:Response regulator transcription factor n=2 Tax=Mumia TaxID=1546255 RepID=A0ABW1QFQ4_9ACTN|nr:MULTISPECIES: response regulator transcription factor [Mumia]KAA1424610.1 response regulator transcription factor [Mumia zhuanghuii]